MHTELKGFRSVGFQSLLGLVFLLIICQGAIAQTKIYIYAGASNVWGSGVNLFLGDSKAFTLKFNYYFADVEFQRRILGSFNLVSGASVFSAGYATDDDSFSSTSEFNAAYLGAPFLVRWNAANRNVFYVDLGVVPFYLMDAHLKESIQKFNNTVTVEGDITKYSNRFYYGIKFQLLILLGRFTTGFFFFVPAKGQSTLNGLEGHWGLNSQQSTYLLSKGFSDFDMFGVKAGMRIK